MGIKAVILAGGLGTRLSEETSTRPKPMVEIGGRPILWHIMKMYSAHGVNDFVICCGYKGYMIKEYFANYCLHMSDVTFDMATGKMQVHRQRAEPWSVTLVDTGDDSMTGGRLRRVRKYVENEREFFFTYGDGVSDVDISATLAFHRAHGRAATLTAVVPPGRFGALQMDGDEITAFTEKPRGDGGFINGGFFVLNPSVIAEIEEDATIWEQQPLQNLAKAGQLMAYQHTGFWQPMDTLRDKQHLEQLAVRQGALEDLGVRGGLLTLTATTTTRPRGGFIKDRLTMIDGGFWRGRTVFLTGHTGFKGSWLALWLQSLGARVHGYSLEPPTQPNLFTAAQVETGLASSTIADVRDLGALRDAMRAAAPDLVFHLAAQPLVRASYDDPVGTYATNVMGTVHLLEAVRATPSVRAVVVVTTDKCYENREWAWGYREDEPMGGHDPYSNSKGCTELVVAAYRASFLKAAGVAVATARAGNVIGGGDWAADRLVPDLLRAFERGAPALIRHPAAVRPWQHVLEPLSGYLLLAQALAENGDAFAEGWNLGPRDEDARPVRWIVERMARAWGPDARWEIETREQPHEAQLLKLDISKARQRLHWTPRWTLATALDRIVAWHQAWRRHDDVRAACLADIADYSKAMTRTDE